MWKNGIFWSNDDGVDSYLELSDNGKAIIVKMRSRVLNPEFLSLRSQIITEVFKSVKDFCPHVTAVESVIDPQQVKQHPIKPLSNLTLFSVVNIASSVVHSKEDVKGEHRSLAISQLLQFEPYAGLGENSLQCIHSVKNIMKNEKIGNSFISHFANEIKADRIEMYLTILRHSCAPKFQSGYSKQELVETLNAWRNETKGTYSCLRDTLNKYSIFDGRNPLVRLIYNFSG